MEQWRQLVLSTGKSRYLCVACILAMGALSAISSYFGGLAPAYQLQVFPLGLAALMCRSLFSASGACFSALLFLVPPLFMARPAGLRQLIEFAVQTLLLSLTVACMRKLRAQFVANAIAARTDNLTGLANRRAFEEALLRTINLQHRTGSVFSLLMLDLDGFKQLNDEYGHLLGDKALCLVADALRLHIKPGELAARLGGDEFAVLLPHEGELGALKLANRIVEVIPGCLATSQGKLAASVGCHTFAQPPASVHIALDWVDRAMYEAKALGKARAVTRSS